MPPPPTLPYPTPPYPTLPSPISSYPPENQTSALTAVYWLGCLDHGLPQVPCLSLLQTPTLPPPHGVLSSICLSRPQGCLQHGVP